MTGSTSGTLSPAFKLFDSSTQQGIFGLAEGAGHFSSDASVGDIVLKAETGKLLLTGSGASSLAISSNNVGIGTTTPGYKLDVNGSINATGLNISGSPVAGSVFGRTGAVVAATNDYTWAQINKTTSSLADLTTRSAGDLSSGTVATARLGSGTADNTTFLRGDNTWAVPSGATQWTTGSGNISYSGGNG